MAPNFPRIDLIRGPTPQKFPEGGAGLFRLNAWKQRTNGSVSGHELLASDRWMDFSVFFFAFVSGERLVEGGGCGTGKMGEGNRSV